MIFIAYFSISHRRAAAFPIRYRDLPLFYATISLTFAAWRAGIEALEMT